jgi:hypothetical protein
MRLEDDKEDAGHIMDASKGVVLLLHFTQSLFCRWGDVVCSKVSMSSAGGGRRPEHRQPVGTTQTSGIC